MIYIINGMSGVGKSTFCTYVKLLAGSKYVEEISTVDLVKEIAHASGYWNGYSKGSAERELFWDLKNVFKKYGEATDYGNIPFWDAVKRVDSFLDSCKVPVEQTAIFINTRDPEEIDQFVNALNAKTILIKRAEIENQGTLGDYDRQIFDYLYDITITNNGTEVDLLREAYKFIQFEGIHFDESKICLIK